MQPESKDKSQSMFETTTAGYSSNLIKRILTDFLLSFQRPTGEMSSSNVKHFLVLQHPSDYLNRSVYNEPVEVRRPASQDVQWKREEQHRKGVL